MLGSVARVSAVWPAVVPASASAPVVAASRKAGPAALPTRLLLPVAAGASKFPHHHESAPEFGGFFVPMTQLRVTGDGHGGQPFWSQPFSPRPQEPGARCRLPRGRHLNSRCPCPSPVTTSFSLSLYSILHTRYSRVFRFPHAAPFESCIFPLPTCQLVNLPAC